VSLGCDRGEGVGCDCHSASHSCQASFTSATSVGASGFENVPNCFNRYAASYRRSCALARDRGHSGRCDARTSTKFSVLYLTQGQYESSLQEIIERDQIAWA
jgi:hypothetical protein